MELSRRIYIKNYPSNDNFLQYRQTNAESLQAALVLYCFEVFLIYDPSKLPLFLRQLDRLAPDLSAHYFGDINQRFSNMKIETFDKLSYDTQFIGFLEALSSRLRKGPEDFANMFCIPIHYYRGETPVVFDQKNYIDIFPLQVFLYNHDSIVLKYPSIQHADLLKSKRNNSETQCIVCLNHIKELFYCPSGCPLCLNCWKDKIQEDDTYDCPQCYFLLSDNMRLQLESMLKNEKETLNNSKVIPEESEYDSSANSAYNEPKFFNYENGELVSKNPDEVPYTSNKNKPVEYEKSTKQIHEEKKDAKRKNPNIEDRKDFKSKNLISEETKDNFNRKSQIPEEKGDRKHNFKSKNLKTEEKKERKDDYQIRILTEKSTKICKKCNKTSAGYVCTQECCCANCSKNKILQSKETGSCKQCLKHYPYDFLQEIYSKTDPTYLLCNDCKTRKPHQLILRKCLLCSDGLICTECLRNKPDIEKRTCNCKSKFKISQNLIGNMPQKFGYTDCCKEKRGDVVLCDSRHIVHVHCAKNRKCPLCFTAIFSIT